MVRFVIIGIVVAVALTLYALVDAAMTDASRARGVSKPIWIVLIVLLPVIGAMLWFLIGKGAQQSRAAQQHRRAPDDDPRFTGTRLSSNDLDAHMRDLEDRLRELDNETFPGEQPVSEAGASPEVDESIASETAQTVEPSTSEATDSGTTATDEPSTLPAPEAESRDARSGEPGKRPDGESTP